MLSYICTVPLPRSPYWPLHWPPATAVALRGWYFRYIYIKGASAERRICTHAARTAIWWHDIRCVASHRSPWNACRRRLYEHKMAYMQATIYIYAMTEKPERHSRYKRIPRDWWKTTRRYQSTPRSRCAKYRARFSAALSAQNAHALLSHFALIEFLKAYCSDYHA